MSNGLCDAHRQGPSASQRRARCQAEGTTRSHLISELSSPVSLPLRLGGLITSGRQKLSEPFSRAWKAAGLAQWTQSLPSLAPGCWAGDDKLDALCTPTAPARLCSFSITSSQHTGKRRPASPVSEARGWGWAWGWGRRRRGQQLGRDEREGKDLPESALKQKWDRSSLQKVGVGPGRAASMGPGAAPVFEHAGDSVRSLLPSGLWANI